MALYELWDVEEDIIVGIYHTSEESRVAARRQGLFSYSIWWTDGPTNKLIERLEAEDLTGKKKEDKVQQEDHLWYGGEDCG